MTYVKTYLHTLKPHVVNLKREAKDLSRDFQRLEVRSKLGSITLYYFWNSGGYPSIKSKLKELRLILLKKILDVRALDYLSEKLLSLKCHKSHDTGSRLPYRLSILCTNSMKRMFFYNAVKRRSV